MPLGSAPPDRVLVDVEELLASEPKLLEHVMIELVDILMSMRTGSPLLPRTQKATYLLQPP